MSSAQAYKFDIYSNKNSIPWGIGHNMPHSLQGFEHKLDKWNCEKIVVEGYHFQCGGWCEATYCVLHFDHAGSFLNNVERVCFIPLRLCLFKHKIV